MGITSVQQPAKIGDRSLELWLGLGSERFSVLGVRATMGALVRHH
jgi:hypothetical protein